MSFIVVYVTHPNVASASHISNTLLSENLIACANTFPIQSAYWWKGNIQNENELVTILKTTKKHWAKLQSRITELHAYEVPCIMKIEVEANGEYEKWIRENVE